MPFWPLTNSNFSTDQSFHQCHDLYTDLDLNRIMSGFHGAFTTGVACQQGTLTFPHTWFRPPFLDLLLLQLLRLYSSSLPCLYCPFCLGRPLVLSRFCFQKKKEEIWLSSITKTPTPTEISKGQSDDANNATKSSITQRLRTDLGRSVGVTTAAKLVFND